MIESLKGNVKDLVAQRGMTKVVVFSKRDTTYSVDISSLAAVTAAGSYLGVDIMYTIYEYLTERKGIF